MQSLCDHSELIHQLFQNLKLMAGLFSPLAGFFCAPAVLVVPVILAPQ